MIRNIHDSFSGGALQARPSPNQPIPEFAKSLALAFNRVRPALTHNNVISGSAVPAYVFRQAGLLDRRPGVLTRYHE